RQRLLTIRCLPRDRTRHRVVLSEFAPREIPQPGPTFARLPLSKQIAPLLPHHDVRLDDVGRCGAGGEAWDLTLQAAFERYAVRSDRTAIARRRLGRANGRAEIHQGVIEATGLLFR